MGKCNLKGSCILKRVCLVSYKKKAMSDLERMSFYNLCCSNNNDVDMVFDLRFVGKVKKNKQLFSSACRRSSTSSFQESC